MKATVLALAALTLVTTACAPFRGKVKLTPLMQPCLVTKSDDKATITCPDGTVLEVPAEIITETITQTVEVPVYVHDKPDACVPAPTPTPHGEGKEHDGEGKEHDDKGEKSHEKSDK